MTFFLWQTIRGNKRKISFNTAELSLFNNVHPKPLKCITAEDACSEQTNKNFRYVDYFSESCIEINFHCKKLIFSAVSPIRIQFPISNSAIQIANKPSENPLFVNWKSII